MWTTKTYKGAPIVIVYSNSNNPNIHNIPKILSLEEYDIV